MLTRARAAVLVVAAVSLAACGNVHPGAAAVVDGQTISMKTADDTAKAICTLTVDSATQQGASTDTISNKDMRQQAVTQLVALAVARKLAKDQGVTVEPRTYELSTDLKDRIAKAVPAGEVSRISKAIEDSQEISAIAIALAAKASNQAPTAETEQSFAAAGQAAITEAFAQNDVHFSPRFGLSPSGKPSADSGSLSVTADRLTATGDGQLPADQRCS